jgi:hypothetical protein
VGGSDAPPKIGGEAGLWLVRDFPGSDSRAAKSSPYSLQRETRIAIARNEREHDKVFNYTQLLHAASLSAAVTCGYLFQQAFNLPFL